MDYGDNSHLLSQNKILKDKLEHLIHNLETRLDKLYRDETTNGPPSNLQISTTDRSTSQYTNNSFSTFRAPYIRDFRNFSAPVNEDAKQIKQLTGAEDVDLISKSKIWTKEAKQQLHDAVLDHYATIHLAKLIKHKNQLIESPSSQLDEEDCKQKLQLIEEQMQQVRARKVPRIFVPEDRFVTNIDWCAVSAKLTSAHDAQDCRLMWSNSLHWSINDGAWTKEEDICLINAVAKYGKNDWDTVAKELNSNRLAWQCCARYNQEYAHVSMPIEDDDVEKIIEIINLCRTGNYVPWNQVMYFIQYHNLNQVKYQWEKYCSERASNSPWSHSEDLLLIAAIKKYGEKNWARIANCIPGRSNKSCRERYMMRLKFGRRALGKWKPREDNLLMSLIEQYGTNWALVSKYFPERNDHQLRNRYELLKDDTKARHIGPIKHRKLIRTPKGELVATGSRPYKSTDEIEIDEQLRKIFSTYRGVNKTAKSIVCRGQQDEVIYHSLIRALCDILMERDRDRSLIDTITFKAVNVGAGMLAPSPTTLRGFRAWTLQQDYLKRSSMIEDLSDLEDVEIDDQILKIIVSIFLWPALLSRLDRPDINISECQIGSLIERETKNLYRVRDLQKQITNH